MDVLYLFHRYRDDVYRLAVNYTRSQQEAEDVCQTVFLKLLEQENIKSEEKVMLHRTMRKLKSEYQQVLSLIYFEQLSNAEAAAVMHRSKRQIENLLYYAKKALRSELEEGGFQYEEL